MNCSKRPPALLHLEKNHSPLIVAIKKSRQNSNINGNTMKFEEQSQHTSGLLSVQQMNAKGCDPTASSEPRDITSVIEKLINDEVQKETEGLQRECRELRDQNRELKQKQVEMEQQIKDFVTKNGLHELWSASLMKPSDVSNGYLSDQPAVPCNDTPRSYSPELGYPDTPLNRSPSPSSSPLMSPPSSEFLSVDSPETLPKCFAETDGHKDPKMNYGNEMDLDQFLKLGPSTGVETSERDVQNEADVLNETNVEVMERSESGDNQDETNLIERFPENLFEFFVHVPITMLEISTLSGHNYLDGQIIDLMTIHYGKEFGEKAISKKVKFANRELFQSWTFIKQIGKISGREIDFTKLIENNGKNNELRNLKNHLNDSELDFDIFEKKAISIPIHHEQHWTYALVLNPKGALIGTKNKNDSKSRCRILFFDSNSPTASSSRFGSTQLLQAVRLVICTFMEARLEQHQIQGHKFKRDRVDVVQVMNVPQQIYSDCGLFVIFFIRGVLSNLSEWLKPEEEDEKYFDWKKLVHPELRSYPSYFRLTVLNRIMQDASQEKREYVAMRFFPPPDTKEIDVQSSTIIPALWFNEKVDSFDEKVASRTRTSCAWKTFSSKSHSVNRGMMKAIERNYEKLKGFDLHYGGNLESKRIEIVEARAIRKGTHQDFGIVKSNALMMKVAETKIKVDTRYIWCDVCNKHFIEGCFLHPMVRIKDIVPAEMNTSSHAYKTCPLDWVRIAKSNLHGYGVFANADCFIGMVFGPFQGIRLRKGANARYSWTVYFPNGSKMDIDSTDQRTSNWMRFVNAPNDDDGNVEAIQFQEDIYYRVIKPIAENEELLVYCGPNYAEDLEKEKQEKARQAEIQSV